MRITFVIPVPNYTGGIRVVALYASMLKERGHTVTVVAPPAPRPTWKSRVRSWLRGKPLARYTARPGSHFDQVSVPFRWLETNRPVVASDLPDADVVIGTWWETMEWIGRVPTEKGVPVHFLQHVETFAPVDPARIDAVYRLPVARVAVSRWIAETIQKDYGQPPIPVVLNAVDAETFQAPARGKQPVPTVGLVYSHSHWKGSDLAFEAIRKARETCPELQVVAFSSDPPPSSDLVPAGLTIEQWPSQGRIRELYASCDAWLFTSRVEGFGLPILEAMACRTPVIGTPAGVAPELLTDGAGLLVPDFDPASIAQAILNVVAMSDPQWRDVSGRARETAARHSWDHACGEFERYLESVVRS